jgi:hypothetical protein
MTATPRPTQFRPAWFSLVSCSKRVRGGEWSNDEKFKNTGMYKGGYSLNRRGGWQHQRPKHCVNV